MQQRNGGEDMPTAHVAVNPDVLLWAVDYSQKNMAAFEEEFPKFPHWLDETDQPTVKQLEDFAKFAYVPFGYLMLPKRPTIRLTPIQDFRTINNQKTVEYSAALRDTIIDMRRRQDWLREYKKQQGYAPVRFIGSAKVGLTDDGLIASIHQELQIQETWRETQKDKAAALRYFLNAVEQTGVVVFINGIVGNNTHRKLNVEEFRGFALTDDFAPVIFINGADSAAGRLFTLLHELVHLFLGQDGLDDQTEPRCNRIAARFLVPETLFIDKWDEYHGEYDALEKYFKVSKPVLYRAALDFGKITKTEWKRLTRLYEEQMKALPPKGSGGDFHKTAPYRVGRGFGKYVMEAVREGTITYNEAYRLTGMKGKTFHTVMDTIEKG